MADIIFPDGTLLKDLVGNRNVYSSDPATSVGAGEIIYQSTAATLKVNTQTVNPTTNPIWTSVGGGGVTDHGALTGLTDDDHTQYLLIAGSRAMTGALNMNTNNVNNVGSISFGAAPILTTTDAGEILFKALTTTMFGMTKTLNKSYVPLDVHNNKITNLSAGTTNGNAIRYEQLIGQYLLLGGGTLSGNLLLGTNNITGVGALGFGAAPVITTTDAGTITFKALTTTILTLAKTLITATVSLVARDHGTAATDEVVNVCYGTSATPPTASTTTEGALYIQYTA